MRIRLRGNFLVTVYPQPLVSMACDSPFFAPSRDGFRTVPVPCGRCPPCRRRRIDAWVFRMMREDLVSDSAHFITLTYDGDHVPLTPNGFMTLTRGHFDTYIFRKGKVTVDRCCFTRYMKRLRKLCPGCKLRYYACGEYGTDNFRPHWHAIVFNVDDDSKFFKAWSLDGVAIGKVDVGYVSDDSIAYTTAYANSSSHRVFHSRDDRVPEFSLMSKGLGLNYVSPETKHYHNADLSRNFLTKSNGDRIAMPRYYRDRIFTDEAKAEQAVVIQDAIGVTNDDRVREFLSYQFGPDYSYEDFCKSQRRSRRDSFFSSLKSRNV